MISTYDFYQTVYYGKLLTEEEFPEYATRADAWLDELTYGRYASLTLYETQRYAVKFAECAIADLCRHMETDVASNPSISKETVGSHSVTYRGSLDSAQGWATRIRETAVRYLFSTGLLYRGAILEFKL